MPPSVSPRSLSHCCCPTFISTAGRGWEGSGAPQDLGIEPPRLGWAGLGLPKVLPQGWFVSSRLKIPVPNCWHHQTENRRISRGFDSVRITLRFGFWGLFFPAPVNTSCYQITTRKNQGRARCHLPDFSTQKFGKRSQTPSLPRGSRVPPAGSPQVPGSGGCARQSSLCVPGTPGRRSPARSDPTWGHPRMSQQPRGDTSGSLQSLLFLFCVPPRIGAETLSGCFGFCLLGFSCVPPRVTRGHWLLSHLPSLPGDGKQKHRRYLKAGRQIL